MRKISVKDLAKLLDNGAAVEMSEEAESRQTKVFEDLVVQMQSLQETQQRAVEVQASAMVETVDKLTNALRGFKGGEVDLKPLEKLIDKLNQPTVVEKPNYRFNVQRNTRGFIIGMTVAPDTPTIN
jgi:hypothetical protein